MDSSSLTSSLISSGDPAAMVSSTSMEGEESSTASITKISLDRPGFFSTPRGQTVKKILIVAAIIGTIAAVVCSLGGAAVIPGMMLGVYIIAGISGAALLTSIVASAVLYKQEQKRPSTVIEMDLTANFVSDKRSIERIIDIFTKDTSERGTKAGGKKEVKLFRVNNSKIKDKQFINGDSSNPQEVTQILTNRLKNSLIKIEKKEDGELYRRLVLCSLADFFAESQTHILARLRNSNGEQEYILQPIQDRANIQQYHFTITQDAIKVRGEIQFKLTNFSNGEEVGLAIIRQDVDLTGEEPKVTAKCLLAWF